MDEQPTDFLATRRSKRSTAGNRMEMALAELGVEDLSKDQEDDKDFHVEKEEEDIFESDFESTDEEAQPTADAEAGEKLVQEEEKKARKTAKSRVEKAVAAAQERQKATFHPENLGKAPQPKKPKARVNRRVSLGVVVDVETGEEIPASSVKGERKSKRRHTILNTSATVTRLKMEEEKRAAAPKKSKVEAKVYTQDELIARALDNEEGNIVEHRNYLQLEDEKRKRARVVRTAVSGPLLRWISKGEEVKIKVVVDSATSSSTPNATPGAQEVAKQCTVASTSQVAARSQTAGQLYPPTPSTGTLMYGQYPYTANLPYMQAAVQSAQNYSGSYSMTMGYPGLTSWFPYQPPSGAPTAVPEKTQETIEKTQKVAKCYVVHELEQREGAPKPGWKETMEAMFGDHVQWDDLKVYVGKNRPLGRPKDKCPITGRPAKYLDPRSGVPFADLQAYEVLTRVLRHEYVWSPTLGSYVGHESLDDVERSRNRQEGTQGASETPAETVSMDTN